MVLLTFTFKKFSLSIQCEISTANNLQFSTAVDLKQDHNNYFSEFGALMSQDGVYILSTEILAMMIKTDSAIRPPQLHTWHTRALKNYSKITYEERR